MACSTRAAMNSGRFWLNPHRAEAAAKPTMAPANTLRAPRRSAIQVDSGRKAAITRM